MASQGVGGRDDDEGRNIPRAILDLVSKQPAGIAGLLIIPRAGRERLLALLDRVLPLREMGIEMAKVVVLR